MTSDQREWPAALQDGPAGERAQLAGDREREAAGQDRSPGDRAPQAGGPDPRGAGRGTRAGDPDPRGAGRGTRAGGRERLDAGQDEQGAGREQLARGRGRTGEWVRTGGLRERKKAKTRSAIRETAMRLFEEQGYSATTVDQIAEEAEVSQSTFFRYFPTKEDVVLTDDYDPLMIAAIQRQAIDVHPIDAVIVAMTEVFGEMTADELAAEQRRQQIFANVPELRARVLQQTVMVVDMFAEVIAERQGLPKDDFSSRVLAGAIVGAVLAVVPVGQGDYSGHNLERITKALRLLRDGLPLG
jgi:AcrR family transcriptional regulator